jgi:hypothetical protein
MVVLVLGPGDSFEVNKPRHDGTGRFQLILQADGNLVNYGYAFRPQPHLYVNGNTGTAFGDDVELHLSVDGIVVLRRKSDPSKVLWQNPRKIFERPNPSFDHAKPEGPSNPRYLYEWSPYGRPPAAGSTLHLQEEGNLVLYTPSMNPPSVPWTMGGWLNAFDPEGDVNGPKIVSHEAIILDAGSSNVASHGPVAIKNNSQRLVEVVTDRNQPTQLKPGDTIALDGLPVDEFLLCGVVWSADPPQKVLHRVCRKDSTGTFYVNQLSAEDFALSRSPHGQSCSMRNEGIGQYVERIGDRLVCAQSPTGKQTRFEFRYLSHDEGRQLYHIFVDGDPVSVSADPRLGGYLRVGISEGPTVFEVVSVSNSSSARIVGIHANNLGVGTGWWWSPKPQGGIREALKATKASCDDASAQFLMEE